jgi:hypothetical protein
VLDPPPPIPIDGLAAPERTRKPQTFQQASHPLLEWYSGSGELGANVRDVRGNSNSEYETSFRDLIESCYLVGQQDRVAQGW